MIARLASPLFVKIGGGIILALLVALGFMWLGKASAERQAAKFQQQLATANAMIEAQNASVEAWQAEARARTEAAKRAQDEARRAGERAEATAREIERERPLSGRCETPARIMGAGL